MCIKKKKKKKIAYVIRKSLQILPFSSQEIAAVQIVSVKFCSHFVVLTIAKVICLSLECMSQCCVSQCSAQE